MLFKLTNTMELDDQASFMTFVPPSSVNSSIEIRPVNLGTRLDGGNFKVVLRIKPVDDQGGAFIVEDENTLLATSPLQNSTAQHKFKFSTILVPSTTQEDCFKSCVIPLLRSFLKGNDCTVMTYGTTSAGKSFTMHGAVGQPGIIPRAIAAIFSVLETLIEPSSYQPRTSTLLQVLSPADIVNENETKQKLLALASPDPCNLPKPSNTLSFGVPSYLDMENFLPTNMTQLSDCATKCKVSLWISMVEIYNEKVIDLLSPQSDLKKKDLTVSEDTDGNFYVRNAQQVNVIDGQEAFQICQVGRSNLHRGATALNDRSSRSHCIVTVTVLQLAENATDMSINQFSFVDLAGSERSKTTQNSGVRLNESNNINKSLTTLGKCIRTMKNNQTSKNQLPVPFRDSKLTKLFKNILCGSGNLTFIVNISPDPKLYGETINVLKFSALAQEVVPVVNKKKSRFSQVAISGSFQLPNFAWGTSQSDLSSVRDNTFDATRLQRQLASAESTIGGLRREMEGLQLKLFETEELMYEAVEEKLAAIDRYNKERMAAKTLRERSGQMYTDMVASQTTEVGAKEAEIKRLKEALKESESEFDSLDDDYNKLEEKYKKLKEKYKHVVDKYKQEMQKQSSSHNEEPGQIEELQRKCQRLERLLNEGAEEYATLNTENYKLIEENVTMKQSIEEQKVLIEDLRSIINTEPEAALTKKEVETNTSWDIGDVETTDAASQFDNYSSSSMAKHSADMFYPAASQTGSPTVGPNASPYTTPTAVNFSRVVVGTVATPFKINSPRIVSDVGTNTPIRVQRFLAGRASMLPSVVQAYGNKTPFKSSSAECCTNTTPLKINSPHIVADAGTNTSAAVVHAGTYMTPIKVPVAEAGINTSPTVLEAATDMTPRKINVAETGVCTSPTVLEAATHMTPRKISVAETGVGTSPTVLEAATHMTPRTISVTETGVGTSPTEVATHMTPIKMSVTDTSPTAIEAGANTSPITIGSQRIVAETSCNTSPMVGVAAIYWSESAMYATPPIRIAPTSSTEACSSIMLSSTDTNTSVMSDPSDLISFKSVEPVPFTPSSLQLNVPPRWKGSKSQENLCDSFSEQRTARSRSSDGNIDIRCQTDDRKLKSFMNSELSLFSNGEEVDTTGSGPLQCIEDKGGISPILTDKKDLKKIVIQGDVTNTPDEKELFKPIDKKRAKKKTNKNTSPEKSHSIGLRSMSKLRHTRNNPCVNQSDNDDLSMPASDLIPKPGQEQPSVAPKSTHANRRNTNKDEQFGGSDQGVTKFENIANSEDVLISAGALPFTSVQQKQNTDEIEKSTKKTRTAKKTRDPFDHPALSRTARGKKKNKENESPEVRVKKKLFSANDTFINSDSDSPFESPVRRRTLRRRQK